VKANATTAGHAHSYPTTTYPKEDHDDHHAHRFGVPMLLTSCRDCASKLVQLEEMWLLSDGRHIARRRCPECERVDTVSAHPLALWAWRHRNERQRATLEQALLELVEDDTRPQSEADAWASFWSPW
jgi:hypothetical protein